MKLRKASERHLQSVPVMDILCFPGEPTYPTHGAEWWVVLRDQRAVGYCGIKVLTPETAFLCRAGVLPSARGNGLQRRMIKARVNWAKRQGLKTVITYTLPHNEVSSNNLIRCGFELYQPDWNYARKDALYWIKTLHPSQKAL